MPTESNGSKTRIIYFLLGLLQAIILGWSWRTENAVGELRIKAATTEANYINIQKSIDKITDILERGK